jgi:hypothetical protein
MADHQNHRSYAPLGFTTDEEAKLNSTRCDFVLTYELYTCGLPDGMDSNVLNSLLRSQRSSTFTTWGAGQSPPIDEIQTWTTFSDTSLEGERFWLKNMMQQDLDNPKLLREKETLYWAMKLRRRDCSILCAILESIVDLKKKGKKSWILPNGDRVTLITIVHKPRYDETLTLKKIK